MQNVGKKGRKNVSDDCVLQSVLLTGSTTGQAVGRNLAGGFAKAICSHTKMLDSRTKYAYRYMYIYMCISI